MMKDNVKALVFKALGFAWYVVMGLYALGLFVQALHGVKESSWFALLWVTVVVIQQATMSGMEALKKSQDRYIAVLERTLGAAFRQLDMYEGNNVEEQDEDERVQSHP